MKGRITLAALLFLAAPGAAQNVRAGIDAWQKNEFGAAVAIWTPLAARGDPDAAFNLGQAYRLGKGVPVDLAKAHQYLEQAARKGHVDASATLGILLFQSGNRTGAMRWIKVAADGGEPRSLLLYGVALFNGDGIAADPVGAYAYVSRAAAQGLASARETLADLDATMPLEQRTKGLAMAKAMVAARQQAPETAKASPPQKSAARTVAATPAAPRPSKAAPPEGAWRIQLGAFAKRAGAEALFAKLSGRVGGRQPFYVAAGNVVRLQIGPYESRSAAAAGCAGLSGQACFPVAAR